MISELLIDDESIFDWWFMIYDWWFIYELLMID